LQLEKWGQWKVKCFPSKQNYSFNKGYSPFSLLNLQ